MACTIAPYHELNTYLHTPGGHMQPNVLGIGVSSRDQLPSSEQMYYTHYTLGAFPSCAN